MKLDELLEQLQYSKTELPYIENYEKEFLMERAIELGLSSSDLDELEERLVQRYTTKKDRYFCPQLGKVKTLKTWKGYFRVVNLDVTKPYRNYTFIKV